MEFFRVTLKSLVHVTHPTKLKMIFNLRFSKKCTRKSVKICVLDYCDFIKTSTSLKWELKNEEFQMVMAIYSSS